MTEAFTAKEISGLKRRCQLPSWRLFSAELREEHRKSRKIAEQMRDRAKKRGGWVMLEDSELERAGSQTNDFPPDNKPWWKFW